MSLEYPSIWGQSECILPNGQPCTLCCFASCIPEIPKEAISDCPYQIKTGCSTQNRKPETCASFECGDQINPDFTIDFLIDVAEQYGLVTPQQADEARERMGLI